MTIKSIGERRVKNIVLNILEKLIMKQRKTIINDFFHQKKSLSNFDDVVYYIKWNKWKVR
jgi:hypothetical protein